MVDLVSDELSEYVNDVVKTYRAFCKSRAGLTSLLYDVDLLPEQLLHVLRVNPPAAGPNSARMAAICELWKERDAAYAAIRALLSPDVTMRSSEAYAEVIRRAVEAGRG